MMKRIALAFCLFASTALAAVDAMGTWTLNTAKSKYTGMPAPKQMTVVYAPQGSGWSYTSTGTAANGDPTKASFTYVKDGEAIATTGFPLWDGLILQNAKADEATGVMQRQGKPVGTLTRTLSPDGKTMTITGKLTTPDGKPASYVAVYERK